MEQSTNSQIQQQEHRQKTHTVKVGYMEFQVPSDRPQPNRRVTLQLTSNECSESLVISPNNKFYASGMFPTNENTIVTELTGITSVKLFATIGPIHTINYPNDQLIKEVKYDSHRERFIPLFIEFKGETLVLVNTDCQILTLFTMSGDTRARLKYFDFVSNAVVLHNDKVQVNGWVWQPCEWTDTFDLNIVYNTTRIFDLLDNVFVDTDTDEED
jgi:hypothetical protein